MRMTDEEAAKFEDQLQTDRVFLRTVMVLKIQALATLARNGAEPERAVQLETELYRLTTMAFR